MIEEAQATGENVSDCELCEADWSCLDALRLWKKGDIFRGASRVTRWWRNQKSHCLRALEVGKAHCLVQERCPRLENCAEDCLGSCLIDAPGPPTNAVDSIGLHVGAEARRPLVDSLRTSDLVPSYNAGCAVSFFLQAGQIRPRIGDPHDGEFFRKLLKSRSDILCVPGVKTENNLSAFACVGPDPDFAG